MKNLLNVESAERVDLRDFLYAFDEGIQDAHRELLGQLMLNPASPGSFKVLSGFTMTNPSGKILQVARGVGLLGQREGVNAYSAALSSSGSTTKAVDLASFPPGNYGVFIRFELEETDSATRAFWDPSGGGAEYQQSIPTRRSANWSLRVESTMPPGGEWLRIGTVAQATMVITDERPLFFEGRPSAAYASGWSTDGGGVANDRNANRSLYGVTNFAQFSNAMRQCLEDIKGRGLRRWWDRDIGGLNVGFDAAPVEDRLAVSAADFYLGISSGTLRRLQYDASNYFEFNPTGTVLSIIGNARVLGTIDPSGGFKLLRGATVGLPSLDVTNADNGYPAMIVHANALSTGSHGLVTKQNGSSYGLVCGTDDASDMFRGQMRIEPGPDQNAPATLEKGALWVSSAGRLAYRSGLQRGGGEIWDAVPGVAAYASNQAITNAVTTEQEISSHKYRIPANAFNQGLYSLGWIYKFLGTQTGATGNVTFRLYVGGQVAFTIGPTPVVSAHRLWCDVQAGYESGGSVADLDVVGSFQYAAFPLSPTINNAFINNEDHTVDVTIRITIQYDTGGGANTFTAQLSSFQIWG